MEGEQISIPAALKSDMKKLAGLMGELGFSKISYKSDSLSVEKIKGHDLSGKPFLEYRIAFKKDSIDFIFNVPQRKSKRAVLLELLPTFLSVLQVAEDFYDIQPSAVYHYINNVLKDTRQMIGKDAIELSTSLSDLQSKHTELIAKYDDLVRSSEANAKILMECERRRDELAKRVEKLTKISDESLRELLYDWIKMHGGNINVKDFAKSNSISVSRVEEGLNGLIEEGFIKRRFE